MPWRSGSAQKLDRILLERAGIGIKNRLVLQFYSEELEAQLAQLEMKHAAGRPVAMPKMRLRDRRSRRGRGTSGLSRSMYPGSL